MQEQYKKLQVSYVSLGAGVVGRALLINSRIIISEGVVGAKSFPGTGKNQRTLGRKVVRVGTAGLGSGEATRGDAPKGHHLLEGPA